MVHGFAAGFRSIGGKLRRRFSGLKSTSSNACSCLQRWLRRHSAGTRRRIHRRSLPMPRWLMQELNHEEQQIAVHC
ncbi:MAG TPA: hypothetical protein VLF15_13250, partial [Pseudoxanthomonas sp.]|nr:hypothetical protein [Pseudoxanthomonas sp.]